MRKQLFRILSAVFAGFLVLPLGVCAKEQGQDAVMLKGENGGTAVQITLPRASGEKISSLQISLKVRPEAAENITAVFEFSQEISGKAKVQEARYNAEKGTLNIYIAGTKPLFEAGEDTITLGRVTASCDGVPESGFSVGVVENSLKFPGGSGSEAIELLEYPEFSSGTITPGPDGGSDGGGGQNNSGNAGHGSWTGSGNQDLQQTLDMAESYAKKDYTLESYAALSEAMKKAKEILNDASASQQEKEAALQELQNAVGALVSAVPDSAKEKSKKSRMSQESVSVTSRPMGWIYLLLALEGLLVLALVIYVKKFVRMKKCIRSDRTYRWR